MRCHKSFCHSVFPRLSTRLDLAKMNGDLKFDYMNALKRVNYTQSQVDVLRESVKSVATIPKSLTNKQLLVFLHANDGDVDKAVTMLTKHYDIRSKAPQIFSNRDVLRPDLKSCFENQDYVHLPPTADYQLVCLHGLKNPIAKNYHYNQATTSFLMMISHLISKHGPSNGLILLYDMKNFASGHLFRNNLRSMKKFFAYIQEAVPIKIHAVHIFNTVPFFNLVMAIIKPVMQPEIYQKMNLHPASLDLDKLHAEILPKANLPSDFGGVCESVDVLTAKQYAELIDERDFLLLEEKQAALELD